MMTMMMMMIIIIIIIIIFMIESIAVCDAYVLASRSTLFPMSTSNSFILHGTSRSGN
jgi:hypothetical protein